MSKKLQYSEKTKKAMRRKSEDMHKRKRKHGFPGDGIGVFLICNIRQRKRAAAWDNPVLQFFIEVNAMTMMMDIRRELPWLNEEERARCQQYEDMTDEEVLDLLRKYAAQLDHPPAKYEVPDADYFRKRFGPWPRVLEKAGLKPFSPTKVRRQEADRKKRLASRKRAAAKRTNHTDKSV